MLLHLVFMVFMVTFEIGIESSCYKESQVLREWVTCIACPTPTTSEIPYNFTQPASLTAQFPWECSVSMGHETETAEAL